MYRATRPDRADVTQRSKEWPILAELRHISATDGIRGIKKGDSHASMAWRPRRCPRRHLELSV